MDKTRLIVIIGTLVLVVVVLTWLLSTDISWFFAPTETKFYAFEYGLYGDRRLSQSFVARYPGLSQVDILFRNRVLEPGAVLFRLKETCTAEQDVVTVSLLDTDIVDGRFHPVQFEPLADSAGHEYCIVLEPAPGTLSQVTVAASAVNVYQAGSATYYAPDAEAQQRVHPLPNSADSAFIPKFSIWLPFVSRGTRVPIQDTDVGLQFHYRGAMLPTLWSLVVNLASGKPAIFGMSGFYPFLLFAYAFVLLLFLWGVWQISMSEPD
jgi:hypothetical protein